MTEMILMLIKAFFIGGLLCAIGQVLILKTQLTSARILVGYVTAGVILGALGLYKPIIEFAGAGATVPLMGFGYALSAWRDGRREGNGDSRRVHRRRDGCGGRHCGGGAVSGTWRRVLFKPKMKS